MKFQPDSTQGPTITGYGPGWVAVNGQKHSGNLIVHATLGYSPWSCIDFENLTTAHFESLIAMQPEFVLFGSGERLRFPQPAWLKALHAKNIGLETMDTHAACRTYNFLAGEGRKVLAALLV
jgi:uncharacterized protein